MLPQKYPNGYYWPECRGNASGRAYPAKRKTDWFDYDLFA